jgi:F-type H+-transporting ATPase subunit epsilon
MAETTEFELVSPERLLLSRPVTMVIMPGSEGYFGAQPGHAPFIATLRPGVIDVYEGDRIADRIFVAGGVAEVTEARCTVLAEDAVAVADLDRTKVEQQVRDLTEDVGDAREDADRRAAEAKLAVARAKLEALTGQPAA